MSLTVKNGFNNKSTYITGTLEMLTGSVENMLVTSIDTTLETGVVPTQ